MIKIFKYSYVHVFLMAFALLFFLSNRADAHCDTLDGPVVKTAERALAAGDVTPMLKWVSSDDEDIIREAFRHTLAVRKLGGEARDLADRYFFETLVRIHRAGEGAPYDGLKPGSDVDPAVALADKAIASGSADKLTKVLSHALEEGIRRRYDRVLETRRHADDSVASGREFVAAYVDFTHFAEGVHGLVKDGAKHHAHP